MSVRGARFAAACALAVGVVAIYATTGRFGLINVDDYEYLVRSKAIVGGLSLDGVKWGWSSVEHAIWMPLTWLSYMIDFTLFGAEPWGAMHLHSALLHAVNAVLVFAYLALLVRRTEGTDTRRLVTITCVAAAFWSLHPLRVESVAWLSSRKDALSFLFEMGAFILWAVAMGRRGVDGAFCAAYLGALVCFGLGACAKPSVMTFPVLQAGVDVFVFRRFRPRMYLLPLGMMLLIGYEAASVQALGGATGDLTNIPFGYRLLNAMSAYGVYLANTVWPVQGLAPQCMCRYPALPRAVVAGVAFSFATGVYLVRRGWELWRKRSDMFMAESSESGVWTYRGETDWTLAGVLWFCFGIGPFLGIANFGYHAFADRFTYIPSVGLALIAVGLLRRTRWVGAACLAGAVVAWGTFSYRQVGYWRDDGTMWRRTLEVDGDGNAVGHGGLGMEAFEIRHDIDTACREFARVREVNEPAYWGFVQMHVYALSEAGRLAEARDALSWYRKTIADYKRKNQRVEHTAMGDMYLTTNFANFRHAELAVDLCDPKTREDAWREIREGTVREGMSHSLAYLIWRYATLTKNEELAAKARETLRKLEKTDYMQFRALTRKEK